MSDFLPPGQAGRGVIAGPSAELEVLVELPKSEPRGLAVIAHPHPLYGGTLDNKIVYMLARAALDVGCVALRFNFRGVGASGGEHDNGRGEQDDLAGVAGYARDAWPGPPLLLAGFSFGSLVALNRCAALEARAVLTVAPPLRMATASAVPDPQAPWWMIHGDADEVVDCEDSVRLAQNAPRPPEVLDIAPGVGHFFHGELLQVRQFAQQFFQQYRRAETP